MMLDKKLKHLPPIVTTAEVDEKVLEDEKFLSEKYDREKSLIQQSYKKRIETAADVAIDPQVVRRLEMQARFQRKQAEKERRLKLMVEKEQFDPQKLYSDKLQIIYQKNMTNLVTKQAAPSQRQVEAFPVTREFEVAKISEEDIETMEKYEKLLYNQH
jgi:hypothetical protein